MRDRRTRRRSLEAAICRDLGRPSPPTTGAVARSALGPAWPERFGAITTGRIGRSALVEILDRSRHELDADLDEPRPWRGPSRRAHRHGREENTDWLGPAFELVRESASPSARPIGAEDLLVFNRAVGGPGEWRTRSMRIDGSRVPFSPDQALGLVGEALDRGNAGREPAEVAASRLHLRLLLAHPLRDGNGRTARLAAAAVLLRAGVKSSLLTCVEQHYHATPRRYWAMLRRLRAGEIGAARMLDDLLGAMAGRAVLAAWVRQRHRALLEHSAASGDADPEVSLRNFELGEGPTALSTHGGQPVEPWHRLRPFLEPRIAAEMRSQLSRAMRDG